MKAFRYDKRSAKIILVTGANGQLGTELRYLLDEHGEEYVAVDVAEMDITNAEKVDEVFAQVKPTLVYHWAAYTAVDAAEDEGKEDEDKMVYGVRVDFFKRGKNSFTIKSARPIPIEGTTKTISLWVCGRNQSHDMYVLVQDYFGSNYELYLGNLGFSGWKKLTCVVPPSPDGEHGIVQSSAYYGDKPGLKVLGFRVDCNPMQARGSYYMYLDDLRAVTDLYDMENHDEDDMLDNW